MQGRAYCFGDNIDTDAIIAARYLNDSDPAVLAAHCMEDIDSGFAARLEHGGIVVAGQNFGCGSSREHAPAALKAAGVSCVIAISFARIFFRNAINIGLPIFECNDAADIAEGDVLAVEASTGVITNLTTEQRLQAAALPPFVQGIVDAGGLLAYLKDGR